ncbi:hypothetical protein [Jatrophihabitans endophyticus]|uniref:hypothetical protein n=1 Tax=Jatrophihabitans endophyticus TaxID=1206085 RepID=UPI0019F68815|nr:hypothetical protein [Jatrophihabitans endophyticus]MBE7190331.1 hypothetical protein [Jatrophihabitans endophyticus]
MYAHVDDNLGLAVPADAPTQAEIFELLRRWGWTVHDVKNFDWTAFYEWIGLRWDLEDLTIELLPRKVRKYRARVAAILASGRATRRDIDQLVGCLIYATSVDLQLSPHVRALIAWRSQVARAPGRTAKLYAVTRAVEQCLRFWHDDALARPQLKASFARPPKLSRRQLASDASNVGIAFVVVDDDGVTRTLAWRLVEGWKRNGRDIGAAESWALRAAAEHAVELAERTGDGPLTHAIDVDNKGVHDAWPKGDDAHPQTDAYLSDAGRRPLTQRRDQRVLRGHVDAHGEDGPFLRDQSGHDETAARRQGLAPRAGRRRDARLSPAAAGRCSAMGARSGFLTSGDAGASRRIAMPPQTS